TEHQHAGNCTGLIRPAPDKISEQGRYGAGNGNPSQGGKGEGVPSRRAPGGGRMRVALLGMGSVGRGVLQMIGEKDLGITVTAVADSRSALIDMGGISIEEALAAKAGHGLCGDNAVSAMDVVTGSAYDVLVEVTPTNATTGEPALTHMLCALERGRHVVTSNKGPISREFSRLREIAVEKGIQLRYEATVGGAIPIMHT